MSRFRLLFPFLLFIAVLGWGTYSIFHLDIHENLNNSIPSNLKSDSFQSVIKRAEKSVFFSLDISEFGGNLIKIDSAGSKLVVQLEEDFQDQLENIHFRSDIDPDLFDSFITEHSYLFLNDSDYQKIAQDLSLNQLGSILEENKVILSSTQGFGTAQRIASDPLHINQLAYKNLTQGMPVQDLLETEGLFISKDRKRLLLTGQLRIDSGDVPLVQQLDSELSFFANEWNKSPIHAELDYFGPFTIVSANASQIKKDIIVTVTLALIFIVALLFFYYRNFTVILLFVLPGIFGIFFSLGLIYLFKGGISALALSASAVIMGIVVDYSFHYFTHLNQEKDPFKARNTIAFPMIISSLTTIIAFISLTFAHSEALRDFGIFTGSSLLFTLVFILLLLPRIIQGIGHRSIQRISPTLDLLVDSIEKLTTRQPRWILPIVLIFTVILGFLAKDVEFEKDLNRLNFYPDELKNKEIAHQNINPDVEKRISVISFGDTEDMAVERSQTLFQILSSDTSFQNLEINSLAHLVFSTSQSQEKATKWNRFWEKNGVELDQNLSQISDSLGFRSTAFSPFLKRINSVAEPVPAFDLIDQFESLQNLVIKDRQTSILTTIVLNKDDIEEIKEVIATIPGTMIIDGESIAESLVNAVKSDFNLLLLLASILVFFTMLIVYGRIETTLITFLPMVMSWIWILGLSVLFGIKFNFINIMIATIIFGLGDDFAIFITDGLYAKYKYGRNELATNKAGIFLSSISTIIGTGVLFFAVHPAIRSIASLSIIGIGTIVVLSFIVQPFLYKVLITRRTSQRKPPYTLLELIMSAFAFSFFFLGSIITTLFTFLIMLVPFLSTKRKKLFIHRLIQFFTFSLIKFMFILKKRYVNKELLDFSNPSIIIANHSSFLDILYLAMQHPKLIFLVGPWVYNSPIFGRFIRYAGYIPAFLPIEDSLDQIQKSVDDGYSIIIFPESHRSEDGQLTRFHKGAFYLSEKLQLDITPVLLQGLHYALPKGEFYVKSAYIFMKILPRISYKDDSWGDGYRERAKSITSYFKKGFGKFTQEKTNPDTLYLPLNYSYIYKGPVLEWYFKIKFRFEKSIYETIHQNLGNRRLIYDLGCGNGFLSYYLKLKDPSRQITGIDYDEDKILTAQNSYLNDGGIQFFSEDISQTDLQRAEVVLLMDVLHYLTPEKQKQVLQNCLSVLKNDGMVFIKDGMNLDSERHQWTLNSEKWSTRLVKFNKSENELSFFDLSYLENWAQENQLTCKILSDSSKSSNLLVRIEQKN